MKNHENQAGTMKNQPRTMINHENRPRTIRNQPETMKNHDNRPGTMKNHKNPTWSCTGWVREVTGGYRRLQEGSDHFS